MDKKRDINIVNSTSKELTTKKTITATIMVIIGTFLYSASIVWLFSLANLTSSGVTGVAQILCSYVDGIFGVSLPFPVIYVVINIPLFIIGYKYVSKRFLYLTILSVGFQFLLLILLETLRDNLGFNPFNIFDGTEDRFVLTLLAGAAAGVGTGLCLKFGGSTGGTDIIANAFVIKKNGSFTKYSLIMDAVIIVACGVSFENGLHFDFETSVFTLIRLFFYLYSISLIYDVYHLINIRIITSHPEELRQMLLDKKLHGFTMYEAKGGFTKENKIVFEVIASQFELQDYIEIAKFIDDHAFVVATPVKALHGNYIKKTIV